MRWAGLQNKIFFLVTGLFTLVLIVTLFSIYNAARNQAEIQLQRQFAVGERVVTEKLNLIQRHLDSSLSTIAKDWALRKAIGEQQETRSLEVIIENHAQRVDASLIWLLKPDLTLNAQTGGITTLAFDHTHAQYLRQQQGLRIMTFGTTHYMMAIEPVRAPSLIGWLVTGKIIDTALLEDLRDLTSLQMSLISATDTSVTDILSASAHHDALQTYLRLEQITQTEPAPETLAIWSLGDNQLATHNMAIGENIEYRYFLLLHENANAALQPLNAFFVDVIPLFLLGVLLAVLGSLAIARSITRPVAALLALVKKVAGGQYQETIPISDRGELGELAKEFAHMQVAVMDREQKITAQSQELARASKAKYDAAIARQEQQVAEAASKAKSQFLANMSHEIRTPLNSIIGYSEMLEDPQLKSVQKKDAAHTINVCGKHLLNIINNVLDVSKIEANKVELEWLSVDLVAFAEEIKTIVLPAAKVKDIDFLLDYQFPIPEAFITDPTRLKQSLVNLANNAIKFTQHGSVTLETCWLEKTGEIQFNIIDTGIGMSEVQQQRLFSAFTQADQSTTRQHGGTGLGLFISKEFTELMGGRIQVTSEPDNGSTFSITLPYRPVENETRICSLTDLRQQSEKTASKTVQIPQLQGHILCADDNADNLRLASYLITKTGVTLTTAVDGEEAFNMAMEQDFDLILMDMQMPKMSGVEATEILKGAGCVAPVVMLTANVDADSRQQIDDCGADGYFPKPIDSQKFYQLLSHHLPPADDGAHATNHLDEKEFTALRAQFIDSLSDYQMQLTEALQPFNGPVLASLCHQLKGNAPFYGLDVLAKIAKQAEQLIQNTDNQQETSSMIRQLLDTIEVITSNEQI